MNHIEFLKTVKDMRDAQKEYFKTRSFSALEKSRHLEKRVDQMIKDNENPGLFG